MMCIKTTSRFRSRILGFALACFIVPTADAQTASARDQAVQAAVAASAAHFLAGDVAAAESALFSVNLNPPSSGQGYLESGRRLIEMALNFRVQKNFTLMQIVAQRALLQLASADSVFGSSGDAKVRSQIRTQQGFVYDYFFHDVSAALNCYQQAVQFNPKATQAAHEVVRLRRLASFINPGP